MDNTLTIHDRAFWFFVLGLIFVGGGIWLFLFFTFYQPQIELTRTVIVLDTPYWSLSLHWPRGDFRAWFNVGTQDWRIWPP